MSFLSGVMADIDIFLADWGEAQSWAPAAGGAATPFTGIFDAEYAELDVGLGVVSKKPAMIVKTSDVAGITPGDTVIVTALLYGITAAAYKLETKQDNPPDLGPGMSRMILKL